MGFFSSPFNKMEKTDNLESGIITFPTIVNNNNGTVTVTGGRYSIYSDNDGAMELNYYDGTTATLTMVNQSTNFICFKVVNSIPTFFLAPTREEINFSNVLIISTVYRFDNILSFLNWGTTGNATAPKLLNRLNRTERFQRESGLPLLESSTRIVNVGTGVVWFGLQPFTIQASTTNTDETSLLKHVAGQWVSDVVTQYNNTQYDNGTNLATLTTNRYAINYIFREVSPDTKRTFIVLGTGDYTLNQAIDATIPDLPMILKNHCIYVGKIIVQKDATTAYSITSAFA